MSQIKFASRQRVGVSVANEAAMSWLVEKREESKLESVYRYSIPSLLYPDMKGFLVKKGSNFPWNWRNRLFCLAGTGLWCFDDRSATEPQFVWNLYGAKVNPVDDPDGISFQLDLDHWPHPVLLRCISDMDRSTWIDAITQASGRIVGKEPWDGSLRQWCTNKPPRDAYERVSADMDADSVSPEKVSWEEALIGGIRDDSDVGEEGTEEHPNCVVNLEGSPVLPSPPDVGGMDPSSHAGAICESLPPAGASLDSADSDEAVGSDDDDADEDLAELEGEVAGAMSAMQQGSSIMQGQGSSNQEASIGQEPLSSPMSSPLGQACEAEVAKEEALAKEAFELS